MNEIRDAMKLLEKKARQLEQAIRLLADLEHSANPGKRVVSQAARQRMARAQRRRWAQAKKNAKVEIMKRVA